jgi:acetyl esterase/lipase
MSLVQGPKGSAIPIGHGFQERFVAWGLRPSCLHTHLSFRGPLAVHPGGWLMGEPADAAATVDRPSVGPGTSHTPLKALSTAGVLDGSPGLDMTRQVSIGLP